MKRCVFSAAGCRHVKVFFHLVALAAGLAVLLAGRVDAYSAPTAVAVKAAKVHTGDGRTIERGTILIQHGRVKAVGIDVPVPDGTTVIEVPGGSVTPGLIDANARLESADLVPESRTWAERDGAASQQTMVGEAPPLFPWFPSSGLGTGIDLQQGAGPQGSQAGAWELGEEPQSDDPIDRDRHVGEEEDLPPFASGVRSSVVINEQSSEVVPHIRVLDALNFRSRDFDRLVRGGVTTVYASPDASAVIGARGAIVHTAGRDASRVLVPAAAVKATIGSEPSSLGTSNRPPSRYYPPSMYVRRPNSRMGLVWVLRKAFYDAARRRDGLPVYGSDTASPEAHAVLIDVLDGKVPLRIQARIQQDILTAVRLAEEFDLTFTLEEATEAYRCIDELKARSVPVIFGPIYQRPSGIRASSGEVSQSRYFTFGALIEAGIPTALSAVDLREEDGLARQAMYAERFGTGFDDALRAVTATPAKLLGLDGQLGTLETGKRADLVVWSGRPFAATSLPLVVLIDGQVVLDRR